MASYPQVLPPPPSYGLLQGLGSGLASGANIYAHGAMGDHFAKKREDRELQRLTAEEERKARQREIFAQGAQASGLERTGLKYDEEGNASYGYEPRETYGDQFKKNPKDAILQAMLGMGDMEGAGQQFNIQQPRPMDPAIQQSQFPVSTLMGQEVPSTGLNYAQTVQKSLRQKFAPGVDEQTLSRDYLGLPQQTEPPEELYADIKAIADSSGGDSNKFMNELNNLSMKYISNPEALKKIKELMDINKKANPSSNQFITVKDLLESIPD